MRKRDNNYDIKVIFDKKYIKCSNINNNIIAKYPRGNNYEDTFVFSSNEFTIAASREKLYKDGTILKNKKNTLTTQILKGLLFYYSVAKEFPHIRKISIVNKHRQSTLFYREPNINIIQPILINKKKEKKFFNWEKILILFNEDNKANTIRIALSYWLKAVASNERYYKFDHLWRAFNCLYLYHGNTFQDNEEKICMRQYIVEHPSFFSQTIAITNSFDHAALRSFQWRNMILNIFENPRKTEAFKDFVLRYHDNRIMDLFKKILPYREKNLKISNFYEEVNCHIQENQSTVNDIELVPLLSIKYASFVRNKMFHGEVPDGTFKLHETDDDINIDRLNKILESLVYELINSNDAL